MIRKLADLEGNLTGNTGDDLKRLHRLKSHFGGRTMFVGREEQNDEMLWRLLTVALDEACKHVNEYTHVYPEDLMKIKEAMR